MRVRIALTLLILAAGLPLFGQKGAESELGFQPGKLYDFSEIDSVNLYNGNLMLTVPIGPRKQVSSTPSYQIQLIYNGKVWDFESWDCSGSQPRAVCEEVLPNRRSNAGLGWRISFGRLLPPFSPTNHPKSSDIRAAFVYEGAAGDEHPFYGDGGDVQVAMDSSALRLIRIPADVHPNAYDIEFTSGETHRFEWEHDAYRLKKISDRFASSIQFVYDYDQDDHRRVLKQTIIDSTLTRHLIQYEVDTDLNESVDRGSIVDFIEYMGVGGQTVLYDFEYTTMSVRLLRGDDDDRVALPVLTDILQPDGSTFHFSYSSDPLSAEPRQGTLTSIDLPTGGRTEYRYQMYSLPVKMTCVGFGPGEAGIRSRTISDGDPLTARTWEYVPTVGPAAPVDYPDPSGDYCCIGSPGSRPVNSPLYWVRTSVLSPVDDVGASEIRTRSDHYFDGYAFAFDFAACSMVPSEPPTPGNPWAAVAQYAYGYPGTVAAPSPPDRKGPLDSTFCIAGDDCPVDVPSVDENGRRLTTEVYSGCTVAGDCTNGRLERSTHTAYEPHPLSVDGSPYPYAGAIEVSQQLKASKTVYHEDDDAGCNGDCFVASDSSEDNGTGLYGKVVQTSNFPGAQTKTSITRYKPWSLADVFNKDTAWITGLYSERSVEEGTAKRRELTCFDDQTGFLQRRRVLRDSDGPGTSDLLTTHEASALGDVAFVRNFGGDKQATLPETHDCSGSVASLGTPWYKVENHYFTPVGGTEFYTGGIPVWSRYYDRETGEPLSFRSLDRTIDPFTGAVLETRDTAGVATNYVYEATPVRLESVTPAGGATSSYEYVNATSSKNAHVIETVTGSTGIIATNTYEFDGLGRVKRVSKTLPNGKVAVTQTNYDKLGRIGSVTQPIEKDQHPFSDVAGYETSFKYDAFDRQTSIRSADGATTTVDYLGVRKKTRQTMVATSLNGSSPATVTELYDDEGRVDSVEEESGPGGAKVATTYSYDINGSLTSVNTTSGNVTQTRTFVYDALGFLDKEAHPETQDPLTGGVEYTDYDDYDARGHAWKRTLGGTTVNFTFDSAERLTELSGPSGPVKEFKFGTVDFVNNGKLTQAIRHNELTSAGNVDVTETYTYAANGQVSTRTTLVERVAVAEGIETRTPIQQFDYGVTYDEHLMPRTIRMPRCTMYGCSVDGGLESVTNERTAGYLTAVNDFATMAYHPSGLVASVQHETPQRATDTYATRFGMARPSKITFTGCTNTTPYFLPGPVVVKANSTTCGLQVTWPAATLCGGASNIKYHVLRDGVEVAGCLTQTTFLDTNVTENSFYTYTIVAEGPQDTGGTGSCQSGKLAELAGARTLYNSCAAETFLSVDGVTASVGVPEEFRAQLHSSNGPVPDEELIFSVLGKEIGRVRTAIDGIAVVRHVVDVAPGSYDKAVVVSYAGGLMPAKTVQADLDAICDSASFSVQPITLSLKAPGGAFPVLVATSANCSWQPLPAADSSGVESFVDVSPIDPETGQPKITKGTGTFTIDVPAMDQSTQVRNTTVAVGSHNVKVKQSSVCSYSFVPEIAYIQAESAGATTSIDISAPEGCAWVISENTSWIHLEEESSGSGPGSFTFRADPNTGLLRKAVFSLEDAQEQVVATGKVNQYAPLLPRRPVLIEDLFGGGEVKNGQNIAMRVDVEGTQLQYTWWRNGTPLQPCEGSTGCSAKTIGPDDSEYPAPGQSVSFQVRVSNSEGSVTSKTVVWTNTTDSQNTCKVPLLQDSLFRENGWPSDQNSPRAGANVSLRIVAIDKTPGGALSYQWYQGMTGDRSAKVPNGEGDDIHVSPQETSFYWVEVTDSNCGAQQSRTGAVFVVGAPRQRILGRTDFNGDSHADVLWHNRNTGQNEIWIMSGTSHTTTVSVVTNASADAQIHSIGDFNGDEQADLVWRDPLTGENDVWLMDGRRLDETVPIESRAGSDWTVGAVADLDNDENQDIVWHNGATGENEIWFQSGTDRAGTWALPSNSGGGWGLHGAGDFNGDEKPDLFFHDATTGASSVWLMNDATRASVSSNDTSSAALRRKPRVSTQAVESMPDLNWVPALVTDMNLDDKPDIVWRNVVTGENVVWIMSGLTRTQTIALESRPDLNWEIGGGGDTNNDTTGGGDTRATTALQVTVDPASVGSLAIVKATLTSGASAVAERELVFTLNGVDAARLLTDANGLATAAISVGNLAAGTYPNAISVRFDGDTTYASSSMNANLVVTAAPPAVTWSDPAPIAYGTALSSVQLNAVADRAGTFVYVPPAGTILDAGYRTLNVTFTPADSGVVPMTRSAVLFVNKAASAVSWTTPSSIAYGTPLSDVQLNAASSLAGVFTYDPVPGTVLPVGNGQALRVTFEPASSNFAPATATTTIDVGKGEQVIRWSNPAPVSLGDALTVAQLNAAVVTSGPAAAGGLVYEPAAGTVLPEGVYELKVIAAETAFYAAASATVDVVVTRSSPLITWSDPAPLPYGTALSSVQLNATASVPGTFTYTPPSGTILSAGSERLAVVFTPADGNYLPATAFATIEINKVTPVVTWSAPAPIVYGMPLSTTQLNASTSILGEFAYTPAAGTVLEAGTRELTARFIPGDIRNYDHVTIKVLLEVTRATQTIVWPQPTPIVYGTALSAAQLNASVQVAGPSPAGAVTYSPNAGAVLQAGAGQILSLSVAETPNYNAASASVTLDVLKATPVLTWPQPSPIVYKTLLDATQLNATSNVPGSLIYSPAAGRMLEAGVHTLTADFTPADTRNYNEASTTTTLEVQKADPVLAWSKPAEIVYGTALSSTQLNATADVPGAFVYTPAAGTILDAGNGQSLAAHFTPGDTRNYNEGDIPTTIDVARAPQRIVWVSPVSIVYGTPLSSAQLNATVEVVGPAAHGALTYTPRAGTVLDAEAGQTLAVAVAETTNYLPASASVALDVLRAPLSLIVDAKSKLYGAPVPTLIGVLAGVVNNDPITASYATTATQQSVTGVYPITGKLVDPNNRLVNYDVTITPSTLTVHPAPLTIAANPASKQYSDPLPQLTATFTGFVLGESPAVLSGVLSIQTTAERLSAPGTYPITIGGLASTNYAIAYVGSAFTVTPEDARVLITSPLLIGGAGSGLTAVTLAATVQDISATTDAAGDVDAGDIRKATLTFVDRATNTPLCTAPIGLLSETDERTGIATCTFMRDFSATLPASLTVAARVAGYYTRDMAGDDVAMTIVAPTEDSITGGGAIGVTSAAGPFAPQTGSALRFNVNLQYDKNGTLKGNLTFTFTRTEGGVVRQYELAAVPRSMSIDRTAAGGVGAVIGTGTLRDITDGTAPVVVAEAAPLIVIATDAGEPSVDDAVSVVLFKLDGGLWLGTGWEGLRAAGQRVSEGNVTVHKKK